MHIVYALEDAPETYSKSCFLAGPTPRAADVQSWRPEAIEILREIGYDGVVFVPEDRSGEFHGDYMGQLEWELLNLKRTDLIVFWIPRELKTMPALTTNIELGRFCESGRIVVGRPDDAVKMAYPDYIYTQITGKPPLTTLRDTLIVANNTLADGALRTGPERQIPLIVWSNEGFQKWLKETQVEDENQMLDAKVHWVWPNTGKWPAERFAIEIKWLEVDNSQSKSYHLFLDTECQIAWVKPEFA